MWTHFWDMSSGGGQKEDFKMLFIEAPQDQAELIFFNRFGHNPNRVTCTCCGPDYSIREDSLKSLVSYHLADKDANGEFEHGSRIGLKQYFALPNIEVIRASDIKPEDLEGELEEQGYVWVD